MPEVATPNQGEREFETGSDEFFKAHSELTAANAKRTYDAYQDLDLVLARRTQLQFDQIQNIALQALQNSVETANMVAKQAVRHADVAADALWTDELNLSATMERVLEERSRKLILPPVNDAAAETQLAPPSEASANIQASLPGPTQSELRRQRRLARYEEVVALFHSGHSQAAISKALGLQRKTIRRWLRRGAFPERKPPHRPPPKVNEFGAYLEQRWNEGCHNATVLYQEIREKGSREALHGGTLCCELEEDRQDHTAKRSREDFAKTCCHPRDPRSRSDDGRATAPV